MPKAAADVLGIGATVTNAVIDEFRDERGVHAETAIAAIAATAGTLLLRDVVGDVLDTFEPGTAMFTDEVNETGPQLLGQLIDIARDAGIEWDSSGDPVPDDNQPHAAYVDLVRRMEPAVNEVLADVDRADWPLVCAFSALDLVVRTESVLDPAIATRLLAFALVSGAKTVPFPFGSPP